MDLNWNKLIRFKSLLIVMVAVTLLGGCADMDVEVDVPFANQLGLDNSKKKMPPIKERAPLILPPTQQLPQPGAVAKAPDNMDWPDDPDERAKKIAELKAKQQEALDKKKGPWNKALNDMMGTGENAQQQGENPVPPGQETQAGAGTLEDLGSAGSSGTDMEKRVEEMIR